MRKYLTVFLRRDFVLLGKTWEHFPHSFSSLFFLSQAWETHSEKILSFPLEFEEGYSTSSFSRLLQLIIACPYLRLLLDGLAQELDHQLHLNPCSSLGSHFRNLTTRLLVLLVLPSENLIQEDPSAKTWKVCRYFGLDSQSKLPKRAKNSCWMFT